MADMAEHEWMLEKSDRNLPSIEEHLVQMEEKEELQKVILSLETKYRNVVIYRIYYDLPFFKSVNY